MPLALAALISLLHAAPPTPLDEAFETVHFPSADGLEITADLYLASDDESTPFVVLCHQAGWSRGEYREIAPKLNRLGLNCLAIDQRSGGEVGGVQNETFRAAQAASLGTTYPDALPDIVAAVEHAREQWAHGEFLLWGSSYSAALAFVVAAEHDVDALLAFSPGEYFARFERPADWIAQAAKRVDVPVFLGSARSEAGAWAPIAAALPGEQLTTFLPESAGHHGSRALWSRNDGHAACWEAVRGFLRARGLEAAAGERDG